MSKVYFTKEISSKSLVRIFEFRINIGGLYNKLMLQLLNVIQLIYDKDRQL